MESGSESDDDGPPFGSIMQTPSHVAMESGSESDDQELPKGSIN